MPRLATQLKKTPLQTKRFFAPLRCAQNDNVFRCKGGFDIGSFAANIKPAEKTRECPSFRPQGGISFLLAESIVLKQKFLSLLYGPKPLNT